MPYPTEHAARLRDPDDFVRIRQLWEAKGVRALGGPLKTKPSGAAVEQAIRFDAKKYTVAEAKQWLKDHNYKPISFEPASGETKAMPAESKLTIEAGAMMQFTPAVLKIEAAAGDKKLPTFSMVAYTGGPMLVDMFYPTPVVVNLDGMQIESQKLPVRLDHDRRQGVGHTTKVGVVDGELHAEGVISRATSWARDVADSGVNGFPWQASIGAPVLEYEYVTEGQNIKVNGQTFAGPVYVVHKSILKEISFVDSGADAKTSVKVAATSSRKEPNMEFSNWLKAQGIDESKLTADERARLEAQFAEMKENGENIVQPPQPTSAPSPAASPAPVPQPVVQAGAPDPIKELRAREAAEIRRVAAIRKHTNGKFSEIEAKAIEEGWTPDKAGYEVLLAARPQAPAIQTGHTAQVANLPKVLECALMMGRAGIAETDLKARFAIEVLDAAYKYRTASFKSIVNMICRFEGRPAPEIHDLPKQWVDAAFSTNTVAYILLNTANKVLLDGYNAIETIARTICKRLSAVDFKTTYAARLTGDYAFQKVGPDGELKHAVIKDQGYAVKVDTYGRLIGLTRQDVINDDLGAFTDLPRQIGRAAALKVEDVFFTLVLANTGSFFASGNTNYDSGASSVIGVAGLNRAVALFRKQTDEDGHPIMISPKFLVVPPELEATARQLYASINLIAVGVPTTAEKTAAAANPHSGKYAPLVSPYLSNTAYTGNSATAWYLFGDPNDLAAFALSYLNGQDTPVIEQADPDPKYLGTIWRGYMDFGVAQLDPRGATKSAGA